MKISSERISWPVLIRLAGVGVNFAFGIVIARLLPPAESGVFFLALAIILGGATVSRLGSDFLILRVANTPGHKSKEISFFALVILATFVLVGIVLFATLIFTRLFSGQNELVIILLVIACILPQAITVSAGALLRGLGKVSIGTTLEIGLIQFVALSIILIQSFCEKLDALEILWSFFYASLIVSVLSCCLILFQLARQRSINLNSKVETYREYFYKHFKALLSAGSASSLFYFGALAPPLLLAISSGSEEVSFYSVAQRVTAVILLFPALQISTAGPIAASSVQNSTIQNLNKVLSRQIRTSTVLALPIVVMLILFPRQIVTLLFGAAYLPASYSILILALGFYFTLFAGNSLQLLQIVGLERTALRVALWSTLIWIICGLPLGINFGAEGVAFLTASIAFISSALGSVYLFKFKKITSYPIPPKKDFSPDSPLEVVFVGFALDQARVDSVEEKSPFSAVQTQLFSLNLIQAIQNANANIWVESFLPLPDFPIAKQIFVKGGDTYLARLDVHGKVRSYVNLPILKHISRFLILCLRSSVEIRKRDPDFVFIYSVNSALLAFGVFLELFTGRKCIVVFTDPPGVVLPSDGYLRRALKRLDDKIVKVQLKFFTGNIVVSEAAASKYFSDKKSLVINGFIDTEIPFRSANPLKEKKDTISITYAGTLDINSGIDLFLESFSSLPELPLSLQIFGTGALTDLVVKYSKQDKRINFGGRIDREQVLSWYLKSDLLVVPRRPKSRESSFVFPSKIHETMMTGIPVLCTRMPGIPDQYFEYLIDAKEGSVSDFRKALIEFVNDLHQSRFVQTDTRNFLISTRNMGEIGLQIREYLFSTQVTNIQKQGIK